MSDLGEFEHRPTCEGCHWHGTRPEVWDIVLLVGHYCYRDSGSPARREVTDDDRDYPLGCCNRWPDALRQSDTPEAKA